MLVLSKLEDIYNNILLNRTGKKGINSLYRDSNIVSKNNLLNTTNSRPETKPYFKDDRSYPNYNVSFIEFTDNEIALDTGNARVSAKVIYYTDNLGEITDIYLISKGNKYVDGNIGRIINNKSGKNFELSITISNQKVETVLIKDSTSYGYDLFDIPFSNKYIACNLDQTLQDYTIKYNLKYSEDHLAIDINTDISLKDGSFFILILQKTLMVK